MPPTGCKCKRSELRTVYVQLWSCQYDPEPTGIGPVSRVLACGLHDRGHKVEVVAAHPHYPEPKWGRRLLPYRETRGGIPVLRLPLWIGRATTMERYRQELTFTAAQFAALPALGRPDVIISASPSFPALLPALTYTGIRQIPWLVWLHDILPDGATATGLVESGLIIDVSRRLENAAYRRADHIVVLSREFITNLTQKGVPKAKIELIYDPATRIPEARTKQAEASPLRLLAMGNIGLSQGLASIVDAFENSDAAKSGKAELVITGDGVAAPQVRDKVRTDSVSMLGMVGDQRLEEELQAASIGLVTQAYEGSEFNIPSKLMNFMAYGLPVLAAVNPAGEVARLVEDSGAGWVIDSSDPDSLGRLVSSLCVSHDALLERGAASRRFADARFTQKGFAQHFEEALVRTVEDSSKKRE